MLRKIRIALAVLFFTAVTLLFLDFTGTLHTWLGWTAEIQFLPALLAMNFVVVAVLVLLTLLLGRVYCSVICPLGVFQDIVAWLSKRNRKKRYTYSPAKSYLRWGVLVVFIAVMALGVTSLAAIIAPYSAYGRIAGNLFAPVYALGNNLLAYVAERAGSYAFYEREVWIRSIPTFIVAVATFVVIVALAWRGGRTYCNTICPVGTVLGFLSRFSWLKPVIDKSACIDCKSCVRKCKASCIDIENHRIDYSRCVACMDCIDTCPKGAVHYVHPKRSQASAAEGGKAGENTPDVSRRRFLTVAAAMTTTSMLKAQEMKVDGGLAVIEDKKIPERKTPIVPAGAMSASHFANHCTACQLCVSECPNDVLRPASDLSRFMQPEMSYERGYCRPECVRCSEVCPAGAIRPISVEEKSSTQIGHAVWVRENCIPLTDGVSCGNCARHCPSGAIQMVPSVPGDESSVRIPVVNVERCIGCGACENLCPARPFSAIYVEGNSVHRTV